MKQKFILFTKTPWDEPPRIRHQLAKLLSENGYSVYFFEKPSNWWEESQASISNAKGIQVLRHKELIHHKLRVHRLLHEVNSIYTTNSINKTLSNITINSDDIIVNFNYEYYFLRDIFPRNKIITVINDDFISRALFGYKAPIFEALEKCLSISDKVYAVSNPLKEGLEKYKKVNLLLPWADMSYLDPRPVLNERNTILYWGYINRRIDFKLVELMLRNERLKEKEIKILFVGPTDVKVNNIIERLNRYENFEYQNALELARLNLDKILAGIIPYRENDLTIDAITLSNKALQILARGLPLLVYGMPNFVCEPFVYRISRDKPEESVKQLSDEFTDVQPLIEKFVNGNTGHSRLRQFLDGAVD